MRDALLKSSLLTLAFALPASASTVNFMVLGVNNTNGNATTAAAVSLIPFTFDTTANTFTASPAINVDSSSPLSELTLSSQSGNHDGMLRLSGDGSLLTFAGYRAASGDPNPILTSASSVNRVIGTYNIATGAISTSQSLTDAYNYSAITSVVTQNGSQFWTGGSAGYTSAANTTFDLSGGVRYIPSNSASTTTNIGMTQTTSGALQPDAVRSILIANNTLYMTTASQSSYKVTGADGNAYYRGTYQIGANVPITGSTSNTYTPIMNDLESSSAKGHEITADSKGTYAPKSDIVFADLNPNIPGYDTAYATGGKQEFEKWSLVSNGSGGYVWQQISIFSFSGATDINGLAISVENPTDVDIFATNDNGIYHFTDTAGYSATPDTLLTSIPTPAEIYSATGNNYQLRGIAEYTAAVPEPASLGVLTLAAAALFRRRTRSHA